MAACKCEGCGGHPDFLERKRLEAAAARERFDAWYEDPANAHIIARIKAEAKVTTEADKATVTA